MLEFAASMAAKMWLNQKLAGFMRVEKLKLVMNEENRQANTVLRLEGEETVVSVCFILKFFLKKGKPHMRIIHVGVPTKEKPWVLGGLRMLIGMDFELPKLAVGLCDDVTEANIEEVVAKGVEND